jgi:AbrB family looped-hinge helix DNA binding protein
MPASLKVSRVQRKGQVTIPQELRERHGIREGEFVAFTETEAGILITPQKVMPAGMVEKLMEQRGRISSVLQGVKQRKKKV